MKSNYFYVVSADSDCHRQSQNQSREIANFSPKTAFDCRQTRLDVQFCYIMHKTNVQNTALNSTVDLYHCCYQSSQIRSKYDQHIPHQPFPITSMSNITLKLSTASKTVIGKKISCQDTDDSMTNYQASNQDIKAINKQVFANRDNRQ